MRRIACALALTVLVLAAAVPGASAAGEISDPCGPGSVSPSGIAPVFPEPQVPWLDICRATVAGVAGDEPLRAVRAVIQVDGDVASGLESGARYELDFVAGQCSVSQSYRIYSGPLHEGQTDVEAHCDYRTEPCPWPESEAPNVSCGRDDQLVLRDSPAVSVTIAGRSIAITFDPNKAPAGSVPRTLAYLLSPGGVLDRVWVQVVHHQGVKRVISGAGLVGDSAFGTGPVPLD